MWRTRPPGVSVRGVEGSAASGNRSTRRDRRAIALRRHQAPLSKPVRKLAEREQSAYDILVLPRARRSWLWRSARHQYQRPGRRYASDLTDEDFAAQRPPCCRRRRVAGGGGDGAARRVTRSSTCCAPAANGACSRGFRRARRSRFPQVLAVGIWTRIGYALMAREQAGRSLPIAAIIDSQSVKTRESGGIRGFDAGKKILGRKRHLLTDTLGLPLVLEVHAADLQDRDGLAEVCRRVRRRFPWLALLRRRRLSGDQRLRRRTRGSASIIVRCPRHAAGSTCCRDRCGLLSAPSSAGLRRAMGHRTFAPTADVAEAGRTSTPWRSLVQLLVSARNH